jgi:RNA-directed DNA polymerase
LKLEIANEKSGIKHHAESIRFLGYDITIKNCERVVKTRSQGRHTKIRSLKGDVELRVPEERLQKFVASHHYGNWETMKATCRTYLINLSDVEIILQFNAELRGIAQYYALAACRRENAMANYKALRLVRSRPFAPEKPPDRLRERPGV